MGRGPSPAALNPAGRWPILADEVESLSPGSEQRSLFWRSAARSAILFSILSLLLARIAGKDAPVRLALKDVTTGFRSPWSRSAHQNPMSTAAFANAVSPVCS